MTQPSENHSNDRHALSKLCRAMLRGSDAPDDVNAQMHAASCAFCSEWRKRRQQLIGLLKQPIVAPAELSAARMLEGIRERIVETCESSPLGQALEQTMPLARTPTPFSDGEPLSDGEQWPEPLLESELLAAELASEFAETGLAAQIRRVPVGPPDWNDVRDSLLSGVRRDMASRAAANTRYGVLAGVGVAAALALCVLLLRESPPNEQPRIAFTELTSLAGVDYSPMSVLRNGGRR